MLKVCISMISLCIQVFGFAQSTVALILTPLKLYGCKYFSVRAEFFVFLVEAFQFLKFHKNEATRDKYNFNRGLNIKHLNMFQLKHS